MSHAWLTTLRRIAKADYWSVAGRAWVAAYVVSMVLHIAAIVGLAVLWWSAADVEQPVKLNELTMLPAEKQQPVVIEAIVPIASANQPAVAGGRSQGSKTVRDKRPIPYQFHLPKSAQTTLLDEGIQLAPAALTEDVGESTPTSGDEGAGVDGTGDGTGSGAGDGSGFFGTKTAGNSFVYVVDCSQSMNQPHESEWKTRFRRLKYELLSSVSKLPEGSQFYIIFFNDHINPMPANALVDATPQARQHYLKWMTRVRAVGDTDPRDALKAAIRLKPDMIYFLTDGAFTFKISRELEKLSQPKVIINTFALGNRTGEPVLKQIAKQNRGKYRFVP